MQFENTPDREAVKRLAASQEAGELMRLLKGKNGLKEAAQEAAGGNAAGLTAMLQSLTQTEEGARVIRQLEERVRQAGLGGK